MWDERYAGAGYLFGTEPASFLLDYSALLMSGSNVLAVADGEGRNSVYLAGLGHRVTAMDASPVAVEKARALANDRGVSVDFHVGDVATWDWTLDAYDAVVAVFVQFAGPSGRAALFEGMKRTLKPGGFLLLHGYRPEQLAYGTGGPPFRENLYTEVLLRDAFDDMETVHLRAYDHSIEEGRGHSGMSALIDLVARKR